MNQFDRALIKAEEEFAPELHVVAAPKGAAKKGVLPAPLRLPSRLKARRPRPELTVLGWEPREQRLRGQK
jgi:hypothetical protein